VGFHFLGDLMSFPLIEIARARIGDVLARLQGPVKSRSQSYRVEPFQNAEPKKLPVPLFGSNPNEAFGLDWVSYRSSQLQGLAMQPQPLQAEFKSVDENMDRPFQPNAAIPSLVGHGRRLDYSTNTDQRPVAHFSGDTVDAWDGQVRNITKRPDFQAVRAKSEPTLGDLHAIDLKTKYEFDFSV
jgi:hypothetical protein